MRIGVFGGSFDPIHNAHLIAAETALEELALDQVHIVVAQQQPLKRGAHARAEDRLAMVRMAVAGIPGLVADRQELDRPAPSFTIDTLRWMRAARPTDELILLLGSDSASAFGQWREPVAIRALASIAVCRRAGEQAPPGFDLSWACPAMAISSTTIRQRAAAGLSLSGWVPEAVASYISGLRLYRETIE